MRESSQKIVNTTGFDKNSDLSTTYLGKSDRSKSDKLKAEEFSHIRARVYFRKTVKWDRMSITIKHRCKQIIYVKIILHALQRTPFFANICFQDTKDSSREWLIHQCAICSSSNYRGT